MMSLKRGAVPILFCFNSFVFSITSPFYFLNFYNPRQLYNFKIRISTIVYDILVQKDGKSQKLVILYEAT